MIRYQETLDCGCKIRDYGQGKLRIIFCPKHAAADAMLETCKAALFNISFYPDIGVETSKMLQAAIAQATESDQ